MNANDRPPAAYTPTVAVAGAADPFAALPDAGELRRALSAYVTAERVRALATAATPDGSQSASAWRAHLAECEDRRRAAAGALAHALAAWRTAAVNAVAAGVRNLSQGRDV